MTFEATRRIRKGDTLNFTYGLKPNSLLLMNYGFLMDGNPHDSAPLTSTVQGIVDVVAGALRGAVGGGRTGEEADALVSHWESGRGDLEQVAFRAVDAVQGVKDAAERADEWAELQFHPQLHFFHGHHFCVFANGGVDPRLLAALSAVWHIALFLEGEWVGRGRSAGWLAGWLAGWRGGWMTGLDL